MLIIKSLHAGVIHRVAELYDTRLASIASLWGFRLTDGEPVLEQEVWQIIADQLPEGDVFDAGYSKVRGEFLVAGSYVKKEAVAADQVSVSLGDRKKTLWVYGERYWSGASFDGPAPMTEMPINYKHAFGGKDYQKNPTGIGFSDVVVEGETRRPLPRIEYPEQRVASKRDTPEPASFGRVDITWPQRKVLGGTYDQAYIERYMPGFPPDLDPEYFNDSAPDQRFESFLDGSEDYRIENMNLEHPILSGKLPGVTARMFLELKQSEGEARFMELENRLETLWFFPTSNLGVLVHRGSLTVDSLLDHGIERLLIAHESTSQPRREEEHYREQMKLRSDPDHGYKHMLNTHPLIPEGVRCGFDAMLEDSQSDPAAWSNLETFVTRQIDQAETSLDEQIKEHAQAMSESDKQPAKSLSELKDVASESSEQQKVLEAMLERMSPGFKEGAAGFDLTRVDMSVLDEIDEYVTELSQAETRKAVAEMEKRIVELRQNPETANSADALEQALADRLLPPILPRFDQIRDQQSQAMKDQIETLEREAFIFQTSGVDSQPLMEEISKLSLALDASMDQADSAYRMSAHLLPAARSPHEGEEASLREVFDRSGHLNSWDGAFVDLSSVQRLGQNMVKALLEFANLSRSLWQKVDFTQAVLAHANLSDAVFEDCQFNKANLGAAHLSGARFVRCQFVESTLSRAQMKGAYFEQCEFSERMDMFIETEFADCHFVDCQLTQAVFHELNMHSVHFERCDLTEASLVNCQTIRAKLLDCNLKSSVWVGCVAEHAEFTGSNIDNIRFVQKCQLADSDFSNTRASLANFRECQLSGARFDKAELNRCDFSQANLYKSSFKQAQVRQSLFTQSNLELVNFDEGDAMEASFQDARMVGGHFTNANLYAANLYGVEVGQTDFRHSNLKKTLFKDWRPDRG